MGVFADEKGQMEEKLKYRSRLMERGSLGVVSVVEKKFSLHGDALRAGTISYLSNIPGSS